MNNKSFHAARETLHNRKGHRLPTALLAFKTEETRANFANADVQRRKIYTLTGTADYRTDLARTDGLDAVGVVDAFLAWVAEYESYE